LDQRIGWTPYPFAASIQDVRVDHGRSHVSVPQELLNRKDVVAIFQQMSGKRMSQRMTARRFSNSCSEASLLHRLLHDGFVEVMTALLS
jgi:hypothetical protein